MARLYLGASGWAYPAWKGKFYPAKISPEEMLPYYAARFGAVELNNSFYRMPSEAMMKKWRDAVPDDFRFALKAPGQITHRRRLVNVEGSLARFVGLANLLGDRRGPLLFQLPPNQRIDLDRLAAFLDLLRPLGQQAAFEFRHESWLSEEVLALLRERDVALCLSETDDSEAPLLPASGFAYLRLRKSEYQPSELLAWKARLDALVSQGRDVYCFFKHEDSAKGPEYVLRVLNAGEGV